MSDQSHFTRASGASVGRHALFVAPNATCALSLRTARRCAYRPTTGVKTTPGPNMASAKPSAAAT